MPTLHQDGRKCCGSSRVSRMVTNEHSISPMAPCLTDLSSAAGDAPTGATNIGMGAGLGEMDETIGTPTTGATQTAMTTVTSYSLRRNTEPSLGPLMLPDALG